MTKTIWWPTSVAANKLGITKDNLLSMRKQIFTSGVHYRPAGMDCGYCWDLDAVRKELQIVRAG